MPSETTIRRVLDEVEPAALAPFYAEVFRYAQRQKVLEVFHSSLDGGLLLTIDGTQGVPSEHIHCSQCLRKQHRVADPEETPRVTHYHQMLGAVLVSPQCPTVPEAITRRYRTPECG